VDPYDVLGVERDADDDEVLEAYRERVKDTHPDRGGSADEFQAVKEAYEAIQGGDAEADEDGTGHNRGTPTQANGTTNERRANGPDPRSDPRSEHDSTPEPEADRSRVEYLNYEVLDDYGWDVDDEDLFEKAAAADLHRTDYGEFSVEPSESILEAAENNGYAWPFACRGGACTNCAIAVVEGEVPPPVSHVLPPDMIDRGIRLSCITEPESDVVKIVYNVKHMPGVEELLLPASRFEMKYSTD
jgi:ferredoxin